ncbi:MAG: HNH endonuclease [Patescibacteria group bacterium]|nr:HNH endonuclease [Patescibacteria group bacterium]MDD4611044.1 HNH endonuclease [Patescibacteria group bacterium]
MGICLFCKNTKNLFSSVEHIFPESLGNKEKILPKGVVCDKCNNETLSLLDSILVNFDPILFQRTIYGIKSKSGKIPTANFSTIDFKNSSGADIEVKLKRKNKGDFAQTINGCKLNFFGKKKMDSKNLKLISRSLYKIALELIYLDYGAVLALSPRFDEIRDIILGKKDFGGYLLLGSNSKSIEAGMSYRFIRTCEDDKEFAFFEFNYLFVKIMFDMERRRSILENGSMIANFYILKFSEINSIQ